LSTRGETGVSFSVNFILKGWIMAGNELKRKMTDIKPAKKRPLSRAAERALKEADLRRKLQETRSATGETGGPKGLEPTRYGDWERKGIVSDF
jgi:hypothetical protein